MSTLTSSSQKNKSSKDLNNKLTDLLLLQKGRVPPQSIELEKRVIGALLTDNKGVDDVIDVLEYKHFYNESHQKVFKSIYSLFNESKKIDVYTVSEKLKSTGELEDIGGDFYLIELSQSVFSSAHIKDHCQILLDKYIKREMISIANAVLKEAYDDTIDPFDLLNNAESKIFDVTNISSKKGPEDIGILVSQISKNIKEKKGDMSGCYTGFEGIDIITSGWQPSDLIIVAARPGMGKTSFIVSMARSMAVDWKIPVAIFSLEMSAAQIGTRLVSSETELPYEKLIKGNLRGDEIEQLDSKVHPLEISPIFIDETPSISVFDLRAKCRKLIRQNGVKIVMIDYLQLMTIGNSSKTGNREQEISMISRSLKSIAKELNIPIIAVSQLSRAVETRGGSKRPLLSDLRESGAIEQDADIVSFIYRPEYYGIEEWEDGTPCRGQAEFILEKHRNGRTGRIKLKFSAGNTKFENMEVASRSNINKNIMEKSNFMINGKDGNDMF
ncbi:replicative DNA helicase [Ichthyobacterium seriolicida]|uniref:Replicative DNA helicase n=1 Tax=Ichthyobacterium seriolicida TaxID=242600 RepID=A0A1J1DYK4_9FLAO|nr:replicative DNA helicase [Ichthyobacterium seriolicida]BAV94994.1 replicative DNA helicase [Ichthyobacterium seriolicida]